MVPRTRAHRALSLAVTAPLALALVVALSACTPLSLFANWGGPSRSSEEAGRTPDATPSPSITPLATPSSTPTPDCVDRVISAAGVYRLGNCENLTVAGSGIKVTAAHLGTLTINGDSLQVLAQTIGALDVNGSRNVVQTNDGIGTVLITGDGNMITCHASVASAIVNGDDNLVRAEGGVDGSVENNGQRNQIGAQP